MTKLCLLPYNKRILRVILVVLNSFSVSELFCFISSVCKAFTVDFGMTPFIDSSISTILIFTSAAKLQKPSQLLSSYKLYIVI